MLSNGALISRVGTALVFNLILFLLSSPVLPMFIESHFTCFVRPTNSPSFVK
jgi:hypothetical protein